MKFVSSQDNGPPSLDNVAYAYTLMLPGNAMVYNNSHEFGTGRDFPKAGRSDALGGLYGNTITTLLDLRNRYGRGNYIPQTIDDGSGGGYRYLKNEFAFERQGSALVLLSNRTDGGYDSRTVHTSFTGGTPLIELTGNAHNTNADPYNDIPQLLVVNGDGTVNARFLRNSSPGKNAFTGDGYLIYGLATPQGSLSLINVAQVMQNAVPTATANADTTAYANAITRLSGVDVIKTNTFKLSLNTVAVNLLGYYRDKPADGDNAVFKVDDGSIVLNGDSALNNTAPDSVVYGFQNFNTTHNPGYFTASGAGAYAQSIDVTKLGQGYHFVTVEAFRHRDDGGPAVYSDWKQTIYVDLAPPNSAVLSFADDQPGVNENRQLVVSSVDALANSVHTFLDLPFGLTDSQVLAQIDSATQANQTDTALYQHYYAGVTSGSHTATVVSYKPDGTYNIQRFTSAQDPYLSTSTYFGSGVGDLNFDGGVSAPDINLFTPIVQSGNTQFNAAADVNGDGSVDLADTFLLGPVLSSHNVDSATWNAFNAFIFSSYVKTHAYTVNGTNVIYEDTAGSTTVSAGSSLTASYVRGNTLSVGAGGNVKIAANSSVNNGVSRLTGLTIAGSSGHWTGQFDLTNQAIVLESTAANRAADFARVLDLVVSANDSGKWDGQGITSSTAGADPRHLHTLGVILNSTSSGQPIYTTFDGQPADANAVLVAYTFFGDANLDGRVDGSDYTKIDASFSNHLTGWINGDFNYDGVVDGSDYTLIDNAFNTQGAASLTQIAAVTSAIAGAGPTAVVPEPSGIAMTLTGAFAVTRRIRSRRAVSAVARDARRRPRISAASEEVGRSVLRPRQQKSSTGPDMTRLESVRGIP